MAYPRAHKKTLPASSVYFCTLRVYYRSLAQASDLVKNFGENSKFHIRTLDSTNKLPNVNIHVHYGTFAPSVCIPNKIIQYASQTRLLRKTVQHIRTSMYSEETEHLSVSSTGCRPTSTDEVWLPDHTIHTLWQSLITSQKGPAWWSFICG